MEQFDEMLKAMAKKEEMMVPNGCGRRWTACPPEKSGGAWAR